MTYFMHLVTSDFFIGFVVGWGACCATVYFRERAAEAKRGSGGHD